MEVTGSPKMNNGIHKWRFARWFSFSKRCFFFFRFFFPFPSSNCEFLQGVFFQPPVLTPDLRFCCSWKLNENGLVFVKGVSLFPSLRHFFRNPFLTVFSMKLLVETVVRLPFCRNGSPLDFYPAWGTNTRNALENGWFFKMIHFLQRGTLGPFA